MGMKWSSAYGTWTIADADLPDSVGRSLEHGGSFRRSFYGTGRRSTRFDKWTITMGWSMVGTTVRDNAAGVAQIDASVLLEYYDGTVTCYAEPGSYSESESGYQVYDIGITLKEV